MRPWPRHYDQQLLTSVPDHWTALAQRWDRAPNEVASRWHELQRKRRHRHPNPARRVSPEQHRVICEMYAAREKVELIALVTGFSTATVLDHAKQQGLGRSRLRLDRNDKRWARAIAAGAVTI